MGRVFRVSSGELELKKVTFEFEDGTQKVLEGQELNTWRTVCLLQSDYLLPGNPSHILAKGFGGIVCGFVPPDAVTRTTNWEEIK